VIKLIVALGNPGIQYRDSRHNIAWMLLEFLSFYPDLSWKNKFSGEIASFRIADEPRHFLRPLTFMNRSGRSVGQALQYLKADPAELLVIHDELELDFGFIGFKEGGGLGGHNGLRSVASVLGTRDFKRVRLGISRPPHDDITGYVLGAFSPEERDALPDFLEPAADLVADTLAEDQFEPMTLSHRKHPLLPTGPPDA